MGSTGRRRTRQRGSVEELPSGALRVSVYAGYDPLTGRRHYLKEIVPAGPKAAAEADKVIRRLAGEVDERRNPRTNATLDQLLDRYLETLDVGRTTHRMYTRYLELHVRPFIGRLKAGAVDPEALDSLYAELRRCRVHCTDRRGTDHRTRLEHECDERCQPHVCKPLSSTTIRHVHFVLRGAYEKGVRWRWVGRNPVMLATPPAALRPDPRPPSAADAARLLEEAWQDQDWGTLVWLTMTTGARRGELCGLRWSDVDLDAGVLTFRRAILQDGRHREEKDTKTHQQRRVALDPETVAILREHRGRYAERAAALGLEVGAGAYVFSPAPDGSTSLRPGTVTQRYGRLARRLGIDTHLHNLRHYSATELIAAGVDVRTVAGRLGHSGGGVTTLRVYAAWLAEADQRASVGLAARVPTRPAQRLPSAERAQLDPQTPRERLAAELREQILSGAVPVGGHLPTMKTLAAERGHSISTIRRAFALLREWGLITDVDRERAQVLPAPLVAVASEKADVDAAPVTRAALEAEAIPADDAVPLAQAAPVAPLVPAVVPAFDELPTAGADMALDAVPTPAPSTVPAVLPWSVRLRGPGGLHAAPRLVRASLDDPDSFRPHLVGIARIEVPDLPDAVEEWISRYELEVRKPADDGPPALVLRWD